MRSINRLDKSNKIRALLGKPGTSRLLYHFGAQWTQSRRDCQSDSFLERIDTLERDGAWGGTHTVILIKGSVAASYHQG